MHRHYIRYTISSLVTAIVNAMKEFYINISSKSIVKIVLTLLLLWFLYMIRDILLIIFVALIFASLIDPVADWCERKKIPRALAVLGVYIVFIGLFVLVGSLLVPAITHEAKALVKSLVTQWDRFASQVDALKQFSSQYGIGNELESSLQTLGSGLQSTFGNVFDTVTGFFGSVFSFILVLVLTFYMVVQEEAIKRAMRVFVPDQYHPFVTQLAIKVKTMLGLWLRGQLALSLIIGVLTYIGLTIIGVPYASVLALMAGIFEVIPYVGPVLAAIPAIFFAFTISPLRALAVLIFFWVMQVMENNLLVPKVMQKAVGLNPLVSIISILVGAKLAGVVGALLAIPVATAVTVIVKEILSQSKKETPPV